MTIRTPTHPHFFTLALQNCRIFVGDYMQHFIKKAFMGLTASFLLMSAVASMFSIQSCYHPVEVQIHHDTDTVIRHDTIPGPAFLRFLSILNNSPASGVIELILNSTQNSEIFTDARPQMRREFFAVPHDS